jgi:hypothetical protein
VPEDERTLLEFLAHEAPSRGVRFLVIGGWALEAHGFARQTVDVDCLIAEPELARLDQLLSGSGFVALASTENFRRYRHQTLGYLDVLLVDAATFEKLFRASQPFTVGRIVLQVPSLSHLIALKLHAAKNDHARELRELTDIEQLARRGSMPADELKRLCAQFGPPDIWDKLSQQLYGSE